MCVGECVFVCMCVSCACMFGFPCVGVCLLVFVFGVCFSYMSGVCVCVCVLVGCSWGLHDCLNLCVPGRSGNTSIIDAVRKQSNSL